MTKFERALASAIVAAVLVSVSASDGAAQDPGDVSSHPWIDSPAPAFDLEQAGGGRLTLSDLKGKYIVLHFGASW